MSQETTRLPFFNQLFISLIERLSLTLQERFGITLTGDLINKLIIGAITAFVIALLSGFLYNIGEAPLLFDQTAYGTPIPVNESMTGQFVIESIIIAFLLGLGTIGMFMIRYTSRYGYEERTATILLVLGLIMLGGALLGILSLFGGKFLFDSWGNKITG
ncbi:MAG: hypothetical protein ACFFCZ_06780 [Promethearchaeota archaeon]